MVGEGKGSFKREGREELEGDLGEGGSFGVGRGRGKIAKFGGEGMGKGVLSADGGFGF